MAKWKHRLRWFVVRTSCTPLAFVYRGLYQLAIWVATRILQRYRSIEAVYLTRGCAKNDISPGISDIDLVVVIRNDSTEMESIRSTLRTLSTFSAGLVEHYPKQVQTLAGLEHRWRTNALWQYRLHEGKKSWKVLYGTDLLSTLPPLGEPEQLKAVYAEMNRWWLLFAQEMAKTQEQSELIMRNVVCYKAVSELLSLDSAMKTGEARYNRTDTLDRLDSQLTGKLREIAARHFLAPDADLMDETLDFLLKFYCELWDRIRQDSGLSSNVELEKSGCGDLEGLRIAEQTREDVRVLSEFVRDCWSGKCLDVQAVKSALWDAHDVLLIIGVGREMVPTQREITHLIEKWRELQNQQVFLFLRVGSVIFPLTPVIPQDLYRGLLTPATAPEVFMQLGTVERNYIHA